MPFGFIAAAVGGASFAAAAAAVTVVGTLEAVAAVGAVLSVVGTVTKNKTLSMIGMGLGVVGGVGALAAGALGAGAVVGADAAASTTAGDAAAIAQAGDSASVAASAAPLGGGAAGDALTTATAGTAASDAVPNVVNGLSATAAGSNPAASIPGAMPEPPIPPDAVPPPAENLSLTSTSEPVGQAQISPNNVATPNPFGNTPPGLLQADAPGQAGVPAAPTAPSGTAAWGEGPVNPAGNALTDTGTPTSGLGSAFSDLATYAGNHQLLAYGALQSAGSLLSGMTSTLTPAQVSALDSQAAANNAAAALTNQQRQNLAMPKATASSSPVTGTPAQLVPTPPGGGFLNQAPAQPKPLAVTGSPA